MRDTVTVNKPATTIEIIWSLQSENGNKSYSLQEKQKPKRWNFATVYTFRQIFNIVWQLK